MTRPDSKATRFEAEASRQAFRANVVGGLSTMPAAAIADLCCVAFPLSIESVAEALFAADALGRARRKRLDGC